MLKRWGIVLLLLLTVAIAVAGYLIQKNKKVVIADPWLAVPSDAVFIIETPDFPELLTMVTDQNGLIMRLSGMKWAANLAAAAAALDSTTASREIRELLNNRKVIVSFHPAGQGHIAPLAIMNTGSSFSFRQLRHMVSRSGAVTSELPEAVGLRILSATYGKGSRRTNIYMAFTSGIIIVSPSQSLVTGALNNKIAGSDIRHQQGFTSVINSSGKDMENLFILFRNLPRFLQSFVNTDDIALLSAAAIAGGGDITIKEDGLFISGFLSTAGAGQGADRLSRISPAEAGVHEVLPVSTVCYQTIMRRPDISGDTAAAPSSINATDMALALSPFTGAEVTNAFIQTEAGRVKMILFRMNDRQGAERVLKDKLQAKYKSMGLGDSRFMSASIGEGREDVIIYKMPFPGVASMLAGEQSETTDDYWVTFCRSYMIFTSGPELLADIRWQIDNERTLINDADFREMEKTLPTKSSFLFYASGSTLKELLSSYLIPSVASTISENTFSGIDGVGLSLSPSNDMIYTSLSFRYADKSGQDQLAAVTVSGDRQSSATSDTLPGLVWKIPLQSSLGARPFIFTNHNTGAREIFIQDIQNNIYLISASGKILWKASIREQIRGDIFMIDYYKNGKNQLLFAGKEYLHLVDRNGNYVDKFPVKLRSPASNKLAVFDYENNKEYRLCIAGEDRKIYMYDRSGALVKGWNLFATRGRVEDKVSFFRVRGKDYLFAADDQTVYILDRTGTTRINLKEQVRKAEGSSVRLATHPDPCILFTSTDGSIVNISFDGSVTTRTIRTFTGNHRSDFSDLNGDGLDEYIFIDKGLLYVFGNNGSEMFSKAFATDDLQGPYTFAFSSSDRKVGVYEESQKLLYLFNRNGSAANGFPCRGGHLFTADKLSGRNSWNLILDGTDGYLYNLEIL